MTGFVAIGLAIAAVALMPWRITVRWTKSWRSRLQWQVRLYGITLRRSREQNAISFKTFQRLRRYLPWLKRFTKQVGGRLELGGLSPAWTGHVVALLLVLPPQWRQLIHVRRQPAGWRSRGWLVLRFSVLELLLYACRR